MTFHASNARRLAWLLAALLGLGLAWAMLQAQPASAATIAVNTTADDTLVNGNCTLREAILAANTDAAVDACPAGHGADTISLPAGDYVLAITRTVLADPLEGDLDILSDLTLNGAGFASTTIDANGLDRAIEVTGAHAHISGVTVQGGDPDFVAGGGLLIDVGSGLTLSGSRVQNNLANYGIWDNGDLTLINSRVRNNLGGGVNINTSGATALILGSTINGNTTDGGGAGVQVTQGTLNLVNSTLTGNDAGGPGGGLFSNGATHLYNVTIANNSAGNDFLAQGGGIDIVSGTLTAANTILSGNTVFSGSTKPDCAGTLTGQGHNLIENTAGCTLIGLTTGDVTGLSAKLGGLQNNGGATLTLALLSGSPAINAGDPAGCLDQLGALLTTDQRGFARPVNGAGLPGGVCDIGAYEANSPGTPVPSATPTRTPTPTATLTPTPFVPNPRINFLPIVE